MTSPGVLYIDAEEPGAYSLIQIPDNWTVHVAGVHGGLSEALNWCLRTFPNERHYGWIADDMQPRTPGWDKALEASAGDRCVSQADDHWAYEMNPTGARSGLEPTAGQCWGGDLIRAVGWWALPGTFQAGTDVAWGRLIHRLDRMNFRDDVVVEHLHWRRGKRWRDSLDTDMHDSNGHAHTQKDLEILYRWVASRDFAITVRRVRIKCPFNQNRRVIARLR